MNLRILIVEDQHLIGKAIQKGLSEEGYAVDWVSTFADGIHMSLEHEYDTLILDLMLPDGSGFEILKTLRSKRARTPVLVLTAKDTLADKLQGFQLGTDDYLTKPFVFDELLVRVRALIRRKYQIYELILDTGPLKLDTNARTVTVHGKQLMLTAKEFAVLELFLLQRSHVLSREKIAAHIYTEEAEQGSNVIDVFINKLRRKLENMGVGNIIETVRGEGYVVR